MSSTIDLQLAEIWCSKLCHDLVSPVGAVCNGVEFLQEAGAASAAEASDLIAQSAGMASDRLQFYRTAYGAAGSQLIMSLGEACQTAESYLKWTKTTLVWPQTSAAAVLEEGLGKVLLNFISLAETALIYGGEITLVPPVSGVGDAEKLPGFTLKITGRKAAFGHGEPAAVSGDIGIDDVTPRSIHAFMTGVFARRLGKQVSFETLSDIEISIVLS